MQRMQESAKRSNKALARLAQATLWSVACSKLLLSQSAINKPAFPKGEKWAGGYDAELYSLPLLRNSPHGGKDRLA